MELDLAAASQIARLARAGGFNILHAHTAHAHTLVSLARHVFSAGCKLVVHRRIEFPINKAALGLSRLKYRLGVDAYIAVCNTLKDQLAEQGLEPWRVFSVRSVTDVERYLNATLDPALRSALGIPEDACVVGNVGMLVAHKDHDNLLEAAAIAIRDIPNLWIVIAGSGPLEGQIREKARTLGLADRLVLAGFRQDIPQLIKIFDLFVISSAIEGICGTLLEAMAGGCPIVTTDAGGIRELVIDGQTGIVVRIRDPAALAAGMVRLAKDPELAGRMVAAGRERAARHFTIDALTQKTLAVYYRVLNDQVGPEYPAPTEP
jgi:glycosyltransferase involved in cell wall biosynthesis